jgi:hypothetical protein
VKQGAEIVLAVLVGGVFGLFCLGCLAPWIGLLWRALQ